MANIFLTQNGGIILGPIASILGKILNAIFVFLNNFGIENAGLCIIIFTFIVNALMIPLTLKQQKFTKLSSIMNPELQKVNQKYAGKKDPESMRKMQLETQAVYEKYGASPTAGCLPLLITLPIMFALYRVIYNIPAYVDSIKRLYQNVAEAILTTDYFGIMSEYASKFATLKADKWEEIASSTITENHLIDIMGQFNASDWSTIASNSNFANIADVIEKNSAEIMSVNNFAFGMNILESPMGQFLADIPVGVKVAYILVPILAVVTQVVQTKIMMASQPTNSGNETMDSTMKSMNTIMPLMSGFFCLSLPVGIGLYWIAGSVFRTIQQIFVNQYMENMDIDMLIEKNREKAKRKKEKRGIDTSASMEELARVRTNTSNKPSDYEKKNTSYKAGSISANAHILGKNNNEKEK